MTSTVNDERIRRLYMYLSQACAAETMPVLCNAKCDKQSAADKKLRNKHSTRVYIPQGTVYMYEYKKVIHSLLRHFCIRSLLLLRYRVCLLVQPSCSYSCWYAVLSLPCGALSCACFQLGGLCSQVTHPVS